MRRSIHGLFITCALALAACSAERPPPAEPSSVRVSRAERKPVRPKKKSLSSKQVQRVMNKKSMDISGCYELSDSKEGSSVESMTVEFEVGVDGRVNGEHLADDGGADEVLSGCILRVVREARFPKAAAPTDVSWPLRFRGGSQ